VKKTNKDDKKKKQQPEARLIMKPALASDWVEPGTFCRDDVSKVAVAVDTDDRGTYYAMQHRPIKRVTISEGKRDRTGSQALSPVEQMALRNPMITEDMLFEALKFKIDYDTARIDPLRSMPMTGLPSSGYMSAADVRDNVQQAKNRVDRIKKMMMRPHRRGLWPALESIVGMEKSITKASGSRGAPQKAWQGFLIQALSMLVDIRNGDLKRG
jgi:hypothetical protein